MAFSANFTRATRREDGTLAVEGASEPAAGSEAILVSLVHAGEMRSALVDKPQDTPWSATFDAGATPFRTGDEVFVVGVARRATCDPFVWQGSFEIKGRTDV